jgi:uncharacterized protein (TIGR02596 family)
MINIHNRTRRNSFLSAAFTLVEMITVVGIIALLVALATPALVDVIRATRLSSSGDSLSNRLSLAQQSAVARSNEVEMRFYKYIDSSNPDASAEPLFYAYQVVDVPNGANPRALSEVYYLDSGIVLSSLTKFSPMLQTTSDQTPDSTGKYLFKPATGLPPGSVKYAALRFYPDGSCRLLTTAAGSSGTSATSTAAATAYTVKPLPKSFFTLVESRTANDTQVPNNFYCLQLDFYTGKVRTYRP